MGVYRDRVFPRLMNAAGNTKENRRIRAAVREYGGVLRPGGLLHFVEHGRAPYVKLQAWQNRLNGLRRRVPCGCNWNCDIPAIIEQGGMTVTSLDTFYAKRDPKVVGWTFQGTAVVSGSRQMVPAHED